MSGRIPLRLAILISGRGSNMAAIVNACADGQIRATVNQVIADRPAAAGLQRAGELGVPTATVAWQAFENRDAFEHALAATLAPLRADLIVLAGFMRILSAQFVEGFAGRLLNIHPSLLPRYRGLHTHRRALGSGDTEHGASVHYVTAELDGGPVIMQARVPVLPGDSERSLAARVQTMEHRIYPEVIGLIAEDRLQLRGTTILLDGHALAAPILRQAGDA